MSNLETEISSEAEQVVESKQVVESDQAVGAVLTNPTVSAYFQSFNEADFETTATLFANEGQLLPPFETAIVGPEAVVAYLVREAKGMKAVPQKETQETLASGETRVEVLGQVQTPLFGVNVGWQFLLNAESEILSVRIKLLAALRDLIGLKR